jgi:hypothetical protein
MNDEITETSWSTLLPERRERDRRENLGAFRGILNAALIAGALWFLVAILVVL